MLTGLIPSRARVTRVLALVLGLALAAPLYTGSADARFGGGSSFGSRGSRTFSMPPSTNTAPRPAFPMQRTETPSFGQQAPSGSAFGRPRFGFGSGLAAGLLGAGLFGLLTGNGLFGGIGGFGSLFGLLIQIVLIVVAVRFALRWFRSRSPAYAGSGPMFRTVNGAASSFGGGGTAARAPLTIEPNDYAAFERLLSEVQYAHAREDAGAMARYATPEMVRVMQADTESNRRRNLRNDMADVRLLQGDVAEAWSENGVDFATVAMRFSARDVMLDRSTGRVASGNPNQPVEATELWTFRRERGGAWLLAAIQQTR